MKRLVILAILIFALGSLTATPSCLSLGPTETGSTTSSSGQPTLRDGDFPNASPCSDRDTLPNDAAFLKAVTDATEVIHIHKEYTDDDHLPAVCGLSGQDNTLETGETGWDPAQGSDTSICYTLGDDLSSFFVAGSGDPAGSNNPGICRSSFGFSSENTADGFPRAGTYRLDACVAGSDGSYQFRTRVIVTGEDANKTMASIPLDGVSSLKVFDAAGAEATTTQQAKDAFTGNPYNFAFTIRSGEEGAETHINVTVQVLCVKRVSSCPTPDLACN